MSFDLFDKVTSRLQSQSGQESADSPDVPELVASFLGNLGMLKDIPVYYLIPDERYLPLGSAQLNGVEVEQGAFKFFWLDSEWIECLMDGATSIGADESRSLLLTKAMGGDYVASVYLSGKKARLKAQLTGAYSPGEFQDEFDNRFAAYLNNGHPSPTLAMNNWQYTGFFMRSTLIQGWPGIEVIAEGRDSDSTDDVIRPLQVIRMERIAVDTLFCICEGIISQVVINQPKEALHFGFEEGNTVDTTKGTVSATVSSADGYCSGGVVDIAGLASALGAADAAQFAQPMLVKPLKFTVDISWNQTDPT
jgi:hypothetical protein